MPKSDAARIRHMLDAAREAMGFMRGRTRQALENERLLSLAIVRLLEIVGEAARQVSESTRRLYPAVPWAKIAGMRNHLIHGYDVIEFEVVWEVLTRDFPPLVAELERILSEHER